MASLSEAQNFKTLWTEAYENVISGKNYSITIGGTSRSLTRQDADLCLRHMQYWEKEVDKIERDSRGIPTRFISPRVK